MSLVTYIISVQLQENLAFIKCLHSKHFFVVQDTIFATNIVTLNHPQYYTLKKIKLKPTTLYQNTGNITIIVLLPCILAEVQNLLTLRRLMSYIYGAPILNVSRSHTTTQHSR